LQIVRGRQSSTHREWAVKTTKPSREYRAICYWSVGDLRMTWLVEVYVSIAQGPSYWRRVDGRAVIGAIREFENNFERMSA
jgi:hypothetical protein